MAILASPEGVVASLTEKAIVVIVEGSSMVRVYNYTIGSNPIVDLVAFQLFMSLKDTKNSFFFFSNVLSRCYILFYGRLSLYD